MKRKVLIIGALIAVLCMGLANDVSAQRWGCRGGYRYRPSRVWIAPPIPRVVVAGPGYGYDYGYGYGRAPRYYRERGYGYARHERYGYNQHRGYGRRW